MRNAVRGDVWKLWLYAAASVALGAWISPLLYNAGKALAEVSVNKTTNGLLEWLAGVCRAADFPRFYQAGLLISAVVLFFPWMEWIQARRGVTMESGGGPWLLRLPPGARIPGHGQPLRENLRGLWHGCAGFLLVSGLLLPMGVALVPAGVFTLRYPVEGLGVCALKILLAVVVPAVVMEVAFRGVAMGIFLRAMKPPLALWMSAVFFAVALSVMPPPGLNVPDPEAARTGFKLLGLVARRLADWQGVCGNFLPLLALGGVLAYARWRTASLWLPIGLHTGWLFAKGMLGALNGPHESLLPNLLIQQGLLPLVAIIIAGVLAHYLTTDPTDETESAARS
jgi:membrane protease YdiL (CAAX protease family)